MLSSAEQGFASQSFAQRFFRANRVPFGLLQHLPVGLLRGLPKVVVTLLVPGLPKATFLSRRARTLVELKLSPTGLTSLAQPSAEQAITNRRFVRAELLLGRAQPKAEQDYRNEVPVVPNCRNYAPATAGHAQPLAEHGQQELREPLCPFLPEKPELRSGNR